MRKEIERINLLKQVSRDEIQEACQRFRHLDCNVALLWSPRVGKTRATLQMFNREKVLICSNSELIRDSWKTEMIGYSGDWKSICYQSLKNELADTYETIVLDECDLVSENYEEMLLNLKPKRFVFLTGTPTMRLRLTMEKLSVSTGKELIKWNISFQQAINWGILPEPSITCLGLKLRDDKAKRDQVFQIGVDKKKKQLTVKYGDHFQHLKYPRKFNLSVQCTELEWVGMINYDIDRWKTIVNNYAEHATLSKKRDWLLSKNLRWNGTADEERFTELQSIINTYVLSSEICLNKLKQTGLIRKNFLADKKNRYIKRLLRFFSLEEERVIIFANSIPQAEFIDNDCVIHSKIKLKKGQQSPLEKFNNGTNRLLVSVGMLERGIGIYNIHTSIILQIPSSQASAMQKSSRNLLDDSPRLVLAYFRDTKDEENVKKFVDQFESKYVKFLNVANT